MSKEKPRAGERAKRRSGEGERRERMKEERITAHLNRQGLPGNLLGELRDLLQYPIGLIQLGLRVSIFRQLNDACSCGTVAHVSCFLSCSEGDNSLCEHRPTPVRLLFQDGKAIQGSLPVCKHEVVDGIVPLDVRQSS